MSLPVHELRPKSVTDLVDETFSIYRRNWRLFVTIGLPLFVPLAVINLVLSHALGLRMGLSRGLFSPATSTGNTAGFGPTYFAGIGGMALLYGVAWLVYLVAFTLAAADTILGRLVTVGEAYQSALPRTPVELLVALKYIIVITVLMIIFPLAIYFAVAWAMAFHVVLFQGTGAWSATGESRRLVRGNWWRVVGMTLLIGIITAVLSGLVDSLGVAFAVLGGVGTAISAILGGLSNAVLQPITYTAWLLLYFDLRARKEGFDLAVAADAMFHGDDGTFATG